MGDIDGKLFSVNPAAINAETYKVFQENKRFVTVIKTANDKMVYAISVGAAMVGSIVFENDDGTSTVKKGDKIEAGQFHGKMRFGGSTVVYLFEEGAVDYDEDLMARCTGNWKKKKSRARASLVHSARSGKTTETTPQSSGKHSLPRRTNTHVTTVPEKDV